MRPSQPGTKRGFTLVELMIVVAVVGILATLAVYGVSKYIQHSKSSEPIQMIGAIKAAQESYRSETFTYLDVSGSKSLSSMTSFYPTDKPTNKAYAWGDVSTPVGQAWQALGVTPDAPVRFAYGCAAGGGSDNIAGHGTALTVANWPTAANGQIWYVVRAVGDLDADGTQSVYVSSSFTGQLIIDKDGE